ncbi:GNAT family N-acetyltransferase [Actinokineospora sp. PR83]|uniref:GNAT family N-acetyltransferase n=1 Tax=Actinokineospora sp. PR83 TaxID=2884908 RepID=UPI0027E1B859|nr:GNAT family N-acetyltransferase [Actinokineospora sp. PR83]MCG8919647.1 GNAT family N-acetyltransferase [Actinokineospora sp. PR83]
MRIEVLAYDHPDSTTLIAEVQQEYVVRYGDVDLTPVDPAEFAPPHGLFLVGYLDGVAVATGGWRRHGEHDAEIKRMYVNASARGRGLARRVLAELEDTARAAGLRRLVLETGDEQPEAIALYRSAGYTPVPPFGYYADEEGSVHLGKVLRPGGDDHDRTRVSDERVGTPE